MSGMHPDHKPWLERLANLNIDRARGPAPHKPLLLLVVLDLIEDGQLAEGVLSKDGNLAFRFSSYWTIVAERRAARPDLRLPFYHMRKDELWVPLNSDGRPSESRDRAMRARIDPAFLTCLQDPGFRVLARRTLIATYFEAHDRSRLSRRLCISPGCVSGGMKVGESRRFEIPCSCAGSSSRSSTQSSSSFFAASSCPLKRNVEPETLLLEPTFSPPQADFQTGGFPPISSRR